LFFISLQYNNCKTIFFLGLSKAEKTRQQSSRKEGYLMAGKTVYLGLNGLKRGSLVISHGFYIDSKELSTKAQEEE